MIFHGYYHQIPEAEIDRFVDGQELGRLLTVGADGTPHIGLYPFVRDGRAIDLHLVRSDEQIVDLDARPRCVFEVDEVLGVIPSYWVHPEFAGSATAYHRTVIFECVGTVTRDPAAVAAQQVRLLARYQPEGGFQPIGADDPLYRAALAKLAAVKLEVIARRPKFKLGQNRSAETRRHIIDKLRSRGRPADRRAADAVEWTLGVGDIDDVQPASPTG